MQRYCYGLLLIAAVYAQAQDPFEIHVYEYETLKPLQFSLEQHLNYWAITAAPSDSQFHMTYELTAGITKQMSIGFMQLNGVIPGQGFEYAGWRVLPHFYAPKSWHLPVDVGFVAEFSFVRSEFLPDTRHVELRPILERTAGAFQLDVNPVAARALHGPGVHDGWTFEPAARVAYGEKTARVRPYLEWYAELNPVEVHQLYPGVDLNLGHNIAWSLGVGAGLTSETPRLVIKSHLEFEFGRHD